MLEYNPPVHGTWNIVHTGLLVPGSHQIYACAINCNRGVVMTAAEMGILNRISTITVSEADILYRDMEKLLIEGTTAIIEKLKERPRMIQLFPSCVHHFMGTDMVTVYKKLEERFPDICFAHCWMDPTMKRHGITPEQRLRREIYAGIRVSEKLQSVNIIGNNFALIDTCSMKQLFKKSGLTCYELATLESYEDYEKQGDSILNLVTHPVALPSAKALKKRLDMDYEYIPLCYDTDAILEQLLRVRQRLIEKMPDVTMLSTEAELTTAHAQTLEKLLQQLDETKEILTSDTKIAIDETFTPRPMGLAKFLLTHGYPVKRLYIDHFSKEEQADRQWLEEHHPELEWMETIAPKMRYSSEEADKESWLSLGQKAAYFTGTGFFVNQVEGAGQFGLEGISQLLQEMRMAMAMRKDTATIVPRKGIGCSCIL